jgi:DNA-binding MarR family transcriptional regulator
MPATRQPIDNEAPARLRSVIGRLSRHLRPTETALAAGLTPTRLAVLQRVSTHRSMRLAELAEAEGINPTMLSRVSADLVAAGLLERASDEGDRRAAWLKATPAGRRLSDRIRKERTDALRLALADLSDADLLAIEKALPALERLTERIR